MPFCIKENQLVTDSFTVVDNKFIFNYISDAPPTTVSVYLLGLALTNSSDSENTCETIANRLNITQSEVLEAFYYWEELGLVYITHAQPPQVVFCSVRGQASILKKIKPSKYSKFGKEIQQIVSGRMISPTEYFEYFTFLEDTLFEPAALLAVAKYCVELKGNDINGHYILTVATNQLQKGNSTLAAVGENMNSQCKYDADLRMIFKNLKISRNVDHYDRELYEKWTVSMGFSLNTLTSIAKSCKSSTIKTMDNLCEEYFKNGVLSTKEIENFRSVKAAMYQTAKKINKIIGVYYQSLDMIVEEYISQWFQKGFDEDTLLTVARDCFKSGIRTLSGFADVIDKFYKLGLVSFDAIAEYIEQVAMLDGQIQGVLEAAGLNRNVTSSDRRLYKTWTENWGFSTEVVLYAAQLAVSTANPIQYLNKILLNFKTAGISTIEQAQQSNSQKQVCATVAKPTDKNAKTIEKHQYTDSQLKAMFSSLDDIDAN